MSEETKSATKTAESKSSDSTESKPKVTAGQNGKGDGPRNNLSESFRRNFDAIDWSK